MTVLAGSDSNSKNPSELMPKCAPGRSGTIGASACGDHYVVGAISFTACLHGPRSDETRLGLKHLDFVAREISRVTQIEIVHMTVALALERGRVELVRADAPAIVGGVVQRMTELSTIPHHFFRHAADVDASAAETTFLDQQALAP